MELEEFLKKSTSDLTLETAQKVLERLKKIEVETVDDLALVQETDLLDLLAPIKTRRLLQIWSCKG